MANQELIDWINNQKLQGCSPQTLYESLIQYGYEPQEINQAFDGARINRQIKSTSPFLETQNWLILLLLCIFSLGIYYPIWFNKVRKKSIEINSKNRISKVLIILLFISSILQVFFLLILTINPILKLTSPIILLLIFLYLISYVLMALFGMITAILIVILAFQTRKVMSAAYSVSKPSGMGTFLFNILYLQVKINNLNKSHNNLQ